MLKKLLPAALLLFVLLTGCGATQQTASEGLQITTTTYPLYLFTNEVVQGVDGVSVTPMINQSVSCVHDYTLSIRDMKVLDQADLILLSGAGLEETMEDALAAANTPMIDCSQGIDLLTTCHHHDHDHDGHEDHDHEGEEPDPHIWLDPMRACQMIGNIAEGLSQTDPAHSETYHANAEAAVQAITEVYDELLPQLENLSCRDIITFHDGFSYFAEAFDLTILRAIEEESGSEASAKEVAEIMEEVKEHHLAAVFTEVNGATATAEMICRECGTAMYPLSMLMSGPADGYGVARYLSVMTDNVETIREACT